MDFVSNSKRQVEEMLKVIEAASIDELFTAIPSHIKLQAPKQDDGLSESEGMTLMEEIASKNTYPSFLNFLGAGSYQHHVPVLVGAICSKSEFLTAYTPYQAEASQGMLQAIFEYQSAICALTGMDVSNASLYDAATACAEGLLMSLRLNKERTKVVVAGTLHPHYKAVVEQCLKSHHIEITTIPFDSSGKLEPAEADKLIDDKTAGVLLQYPNFFGVIDNLHPLIEKAKNVGALSVICGNPLAYGIYASPAELGADIAVGDVQPLGLPMQFGGPYVGYIACKSEFLRQIPGRIVGETVDLDGKRGFVLTFQAREQHIRREKATSNICTNQALAALACLVAILWYGPNGIKQLALTNFQRTSYLKAQLELLPGVTMMGQNPIFNEFAVNFGVPTEEVYQTFRAQGIEPGVNLGEYFPELEGYILVAVTEVKTKEMLNRYVEAAKKLCKEKVLT